MKDLGMTVLRLMQTEMEKTYEGRDYGTCPHHETLEPALLVIHGRVRGSQPFSRL